MANDRNLTLLTDLYQLTMMNGYLKEGRKDEIAVFDVFFRQNGMITYSVACGLEQAVDYVTNLRFGEEELAYLKGLGIFSQEFLEYLKDFKFTGDVYAVPEGTVVFPGEPIFTVKAPIMQAQLIETAVLNIINFQTLIATKAAKIRYAAKNDLVMEFGLRRAQAPDAGIYGARAGYRRVRFYFKRACRQNVRYSRFRYARAQLGYELQRRIHRIQGLRGRLSR